MNKIVIIKYNVPNKIYSLPVTFCNDCHHSTILLLLQKVYFNGDKIMWAMVKSGYFVNWKIQNILPENINWMKIIGLILSCFVFYIVIC